MPRKTLERIQIIDNLLSSSKTGNSFEFSRKLKISRSALFVYFSVMKRKGAPIIWDKKRNTYRYSTDGYFNITFIDNS